MRAAVRKIVRRCPQLTNCTAYSSLCLVDRQSAHHLKMRRSNDHTNTGITPPDVFCCGAGRRLSACLDGMPMIPSLFPRPRCAGQSGGAAWDSCTFPKWDANWVSVFPKQGGILPSCRPHSEHARPRFLLDAADGVFDLELKNSYSRDNACYGQLTGSFSAERAKHRGRRLRAGHTRSTRSRAKSSRQGDAPAVAQSWHVDLTTPLGACDGGMSCVYENSLSWSLAPRRSPPRPIPAVLFERAVWRVARATSLLRCAEDGSMNDFVSDDIAARSEEARRGRPHQAQPVPGVGTGDRAPHSESRRTNGQVPVAGSASSVGVPSRLCRPRQVDVSLQVLAMQTGHNPDHFVSAAREASTPHVPEVGISEAHHPISHHETIPRSSGSSPRSTRIMCRCSPTTWRS